MTDLSKALNQGKAYWQRITDLNNHQQADWLAQSEKVYDTLFEGPYKEPFDNFRGYISQEKIDDYYYVGMYKGKVVGMLFFTIYPEWLFIAYGGVDYYRLPKNILHGKICAGLLGIVDEYVKKSCCRGVLFELEKLDEKYLLEMVNEKAPLIEGQERRKEQIINRIRATYSFQDYGAWNIPCINYLQPLPGSGEEAREAEMHLMYVPAVPSLNPPVLTRDEIIGILDFIYSQYYKDGFEESQDWILGGHEQTYKYLKQLPKRTINNYPSRSKLSKIKIEDYFNRVFNTLGEKTDNVEEFTRLVNKVVVLEPNLFGMGLNFNVLIDKVINKFKSWHKSKTNLADS